jgi:hypothetical protein
MGQRDAPSVMIVLGLEIVTDSAAGQFVIAPRRALHQPPPRQVFL